MEATARVLYVDDEPGLCRLFTRLFSGVSGFDVSALTSAMEAANLIRTSSFDVIVSDLTMPGEDGLWLLEQIRRLKREHGRSVPAIAVTAHRERYAASRLTPWAGQRLRLGDEPGQLDAPLR